MLDLQPSHLSFDRHLACKQRLSHTRKGLRRARTRARRLEMQFDPVRETLALLLSEVMPIYFRLLHTVTLTRCAQIGRSRAYASAPESPSACVFSQADPVPNHGGSGLYPREAKASAC